MLEDSCPRFGYSLRNYAEFVIECVIWQFHTNNSTLAGLAAVTHSVLKSTEIVGSRQMDAVAVVLKFDLSVKIQQSI